MTKSELIEKLATRQSQLSAKEVESAIKEMLEQMAPTLETGDRIEIRGFSSFSHHYRAPRTGRTPKTGTSVDQELEAINVSYTMGGMTIAAYSAKGDNIGNVSATTSDKNEVRLSFAF